MYKLGIISFYKHKLFSQSYFIGICGDSGSGKTTLSNSIKAIFGKQETLEIHGDDMHKWERGDSNWDQLTHLNPKANNLYSDINYLKAIKNNKAIYRKHYDHNTGKFTDYNKIIGKNLIIYDGLHTFYMKQMRDYFDLKIFVKPNEELRKKWKIDRDTIKRNYSKEKILQQLEARKQDSEKFISVQRQYADIILEYNANQGIKITLNSEYDIEELLNESAKINLKILHEYEENMMQYIIIQNTVSQEDIIKLAQALNIKNYLEDFGILNSEWQDGNLGFIQILIFYIICNDQ